MARGTQDGYNTGLMQGAGTGPVNPIAMPEQGGTAGIDQLFKTMFPNQPITSPMGAPQTIDMKPPITSPMQGSGGPTFLGDPSPGKLNFGTAPKPAQPRPVRPFGGGFGGQNPFFK
jgi:hypothetical protein